MDNDNHFEQAFFRQLEEARKNDPLVGAKMGAEDIWNTLIKAFQEPNGRLNAKVVLLWTSGLAGYACQASAWEKAKLEGTSPELFTIGTKNGKTFYMGEGINKPLLSSQYSIWSLAAGIYKQLEPSQALPDIMELVRTSVDRLGDDNYKIWDEVDTKDVENEYGMLWKVMKNKATAYCRNPDEWSLLFGLVLQKALQMMIKVAPPEWNCLEKAMENALYISKIKIVL